MECLSNSYSPCHPHLWAAAWLAYRSNLLLLAKYDSVILDLFSICLLDYYFSLFLFLKAFEADGSAKGCLVRNVFMTIKIAALCKWLGAGLEGENSFAVTILRFAVVRCESVI